MLESLPRLARKYFHLSSNFTRFPSTGNLNVNVKPNALTVTFRKFKVSSKGPFVSTDGRTDGLTDSHSDYTADPRVMQLATCEGNWEMRKIENR